MLPPPFQINFFGWLLIYLVTTLAYSLRLKRVMHRRRHRPLRPLHHPHPRRLRCHWSSRLHLARRLQHLLLPLPRLRQALLRTRKSPRAWRSLRSGRGYHVSDLEQLRTFGSSSAYASVVVLTLYISNLDAAQLYSHTNRLWLLVPVLLLWLSRLWLLASRGHLHEDPVVYAITDKRSLLMGLLVALIILSAL